MGSHLLIGSGCFSSSLRIPLIIQYASMCTCELKGGMPHEHGCYREAGAYVPYHCVYCSVPGIRDSSAHALHTGLLRPQRKSQQCPPSFPWITLLAPRSSASLSVLRMCPRLSKNSAYVISILQGLWHHLLAGLSLLYGELWERSHTTEILCAI
jgi:hypothetical protein